ncbi:MAG: TonB-dependent receptor [Tannerella sp.]|jgi:TonB-linked SusC/RagA family outer membrane protein|nr:TonB-dependent receptor [Tannerella sp.]
MKSRKKVVFYLFLVVVCCVAQITAWATPTTNTELSAMQQRRTVTGLVVDNNGEPLPGVTIIERGVTSSGTITDVAGRFSVNVSENATLVFSFIGFRSVELTAANANNATVTLIEDALMLDEVIITGYTTQKKADLTGAISVVKTEHLKSSIAGSSMRAVQGRIAGMSVSTTGSPNPDATIRIRGEGTLNNRDPLYIIDGTPTTRSMGELASMDIESIQVLKDASSASIYGSRAANGVIIITTRKGSKGTTVDLSTSYSTVSAKKPYELMNTEQRGIAQFWAIVNANPNANPNVTGIGQLYNYDYNRDTNGNFVLNKVTWKEYINAAQTMKAADTDWMKEIMRTGSVQQYNLTLSTGSDTGFSVFGLDYYDSEGTVKGTYFERISARLNSEYTFLNGRVKVGENFTVSKWRQSTNVGSGNLGQTKELMSIVPIHTIDGVGWGGPVGGMSDRQNPVRLIEDNKQNYEDFIRLFGNVFVNIELMKGLTFRSTFGGDYVGRWRKEMLKTYVSGFMSENKAKLTQTSRYNANWTNSNVLQYVFKSGKHNFDVMLGQETIHSMSQSFWASRRVFASETPEYMQLNAGEEERDNAGETSTNVMISWFGKANYNYAGSYLASVTLRRDASSVFGTNNRWATFPAFSVGWLLSNESFFSDLITAVPYLKLRYGWGQNGNSQINDYAAYQMYGYLYDASDVWNWNWGTAYDFTGNGGTLPAGFRRTQRANPNLKWETTAQHNFGLDFGFLNSKLSGAFNYYIKKTSDILIRPGYVATIGEGGSMWYNGATVENKGFELELNYAERINDVGINISGVFSYNKHTMKHIPTEIINNYAGNGQEHNILGRPRQSVYGYIADGLFQSQEEVTSAPTQTGAAPGRIRYRDINGRDTNGKLTGKPDGKIDAADRTWIADLTPALEYGINIGFTWKGFDFAMFFNGVAGRDLNVRNWKGWTDIYSLGTVGENYGTRMLDAWTPTNTKSTIPAIHLNNYNDEGRTSTYYIESGAYMKIRNIELGYTVPANILNNLHIKRARLSLRLDNVYTFMKTWGDNPYTGIDPETPGNDYPLPFSTTIGLNVTF